MSTGNLTIGTGNLTVNGATGNVSGLGDITIASGKHYQINGTALVAGDVGAATAPAAGTQSISGANVTLAFGTNSILNVTVTGNVTSWVSTGPTGISIGDTKVAYLTNGSTYTIATTGIGLKRGSTGLDKIAEPYDELAITCTAANTFVWSAINCIAP